MCSALSPCSGPVFRMERAVPITGQSPRAVLHWTEGTRREADRSESGCWEAAQRKTLSSPLLSFLLLCRLHLSSPPALCPSAQAAEKPSHPSCAGIRMFLGDRQISGLAPVQRERGLVMQIHTLKRAGVKITHTKKPGGKRAPILCF